ncbi:hypothetical protein PGB90_002205 [Kerria lacca]
MTHRCYDGMMPKTNATEHHFVSSVQNIFLFHFRKENSDFEWTEELVLKFIDLYREKEVLWNTKHPKYYNKIKKNDAWLQIANAMKKATDKCCKIRNLKSAGDILELLSRSRNLNKTDTYKNLSPLLGRNGLIIADADIWRVHRKKISPSFNKKMLENSIPIIVENTKILVEQFKNKVDQSEFGIREFLDNCSLDILCEITTGIKLRTQESPELFYKVTDEILHALNARILQPWLRFDFIFRLSKYGKITRDFVKLHRNRQKKIINERKKMLKNCEEVKLSTEGCEKMMPLLDFLLKESNFTDEEIEDDVLSIMFAGQDAPAVITTLCLYELSRNERVQDKLLDELKNNILNKNCEPTFDDYMNLKYLDFVIKETMRMYPPALFVGRKIDEDVHLPSGYFLPANTSAYIFIYKLHHDEKYYPNHDEFIPERFENIDESYRYIYIPFSAGVRNCIGQIFGLIEIKILVSSVLLKYRLLPAIRTKKIRLEVGTVLHCLDTVSLRITSRKL